MSLAVYRQGPASKRSWSWEAARWLERDAPPLVLLVNKVDRSSRLDVAALERTIPLARGLVQVPHDRAGADQSLTRRFS